MNYELRIKNSLLTLTIKRVRVFVAGWFRRLIFIIHNSRFNIQNSRGFSMVELMVTVSIFVVITGIVLVKNSGFNSSIRLTNLAYEVGLKIREAQTYGVSVKEFGVGTGTFTVAYGVHFQKTSPTVFQFFGDANGNMSYDAGNEFIDELSMVGGNRIKKMCVLSSSGAESCSDTGLMDNLVILFQRPKFEAIIIPRSGGAKLPGSYQSASIVVSSSDGVSERTIGVHATGQITVTK